MIRKDNFGYDKFECSTCGTEVLEFADCCQKCGKQFIGESKIPKFIEKVKKETYFLIEGKGIKLDLDEEYKFQIFKQIKLLRIESYFNYIIRLIFQEDYLKKNLTVDKAKLLNLYYETSTKILKDNASIILDNSINPYDDYQTSFYWEEHHLYYGKQLGLIIKTILDIINFDREIKLLLNISENENPYNSSKAHQFIQNLIIIAYSQATQRIENEINNENYLGIEILKNNNNEEELIVYLTPIGMMSVPEYFTNIDNEDKIPKFIKLLNQIGIQKIENEEIKQKYDSSIILAFDNKLYVHYKQYNLSYNSFFNKRINRPHINSIILETQANYRKI